MAGIAFVALLFVLLFLVPWHYAGYFNGRYERGRREAQKRRRM